MKSVDEMRTFFQNATLNTNPVRDQAVLADALGAAGLTTEQRPAPGGSRIWRFTMRSPLMKLAIAAAVIVAVAIGLYTFGGSRPAFADVVKPVLTARTAVYTILATMPDKPVFKVQGEFMEPGLTRQTMGAEDGPDKEIIYVMDCVQGKALALVPSRKTAVLVELKDVTKELDPRALNMFTDLRRRIQLAGEHPDESVEYLGASRIGGRHVLGYRFLEEGFRTTLWADATSLLPLQIETAPANAPADQPADIVMMDIQFDVPLDPAEFSLAVPPGYSQQTMQMDGSPPTEADVIVLLGFYAEATQGKFPSTLDMANAKELMQAFKGKIPSEEPNLDEPAGREAFQKVMQDMMKIMRGLAFVQKLPPEADRHYAGAAATSGDATKPIFWYRPPGAATYRVIYADLSIRDVAPEDLPK